MKLSILSRLFVLFSLAILSTTSAFCAEIIPPETRTTGNWYKGQTHDHSFWSDGRTFPELVAQKYKDAGFNFVVNTDHNRLAKGEKWKLVVDGNKGPRDVEAVKELQELFKDKEGWITERTKNGNTEIRLKEFKDVSKWANEPGKFLLIQGCETTGKAFNRQIHVNGLNVSQPIRPQAGKSVAEIISANIAANVNVPAKSDEPAIATLNHPNWPSFDIEAETMASIPNLRFMEICNLSAGCHRFSDGKHHSVDHKWDIANTLRISQKNLAPIYGVAIDDAHRYYGNPAGYNGGWIMVRAEKLDVASLFDAMHRGDYYGSTGVTLKDVQYDPKKKTLTVEVDPREGVNYEIRFVGTMKDYDQKTSERTDTRPNNHTITVYSDDVGKTFKTVKGTKAVYQLTGDELFVRAHIISDRDLDRKNEFDKFFKADALTQPVGWEKYIK